MLLDCINFSSLVKYYYIILSVKGSQNISPQATLTSPAVHILCMDILGGWVSD
jgi:hypothetical protein